MTNSNITLSAYKVTWVEFFPIDGKTVTIHDQKALGAIVTHKGLKTFRRSFASMTDAKSFLNSFYKTLDKGYTCLFSTDKQFSLAKESDNYAIPYTEQQKKSPYHLSCSPVLRLQQEIDEEGGFCNWQHWNINEVMEWILANYKAPKWVAKEVAYLIK